MSTVVSSSYNAREIVIDFNSNFKTTIEFPSNIVFVPSIMTAVAFNSFILLRFTRSSLATDRMTGKTIAAGQYPSALYVIESLHDAANYISVPIGGLPIKVAFNPSGSCIAVSFIEGWYC